MTAKDYGVPKGLPKQTTSICPECRQLLTATLSERDGKVYIDKECPEHGSFSDVYWSDAELFLRAERYAYDGIGLINPSDKSSGGRNVNVVIGDKPFEMLTCTALANIDLTNRCNMRCPICFANANQSGYVYEPDYDTVVSMLKALRAEKPIKCTAVQFSGGEPTIYPRFVDIIKKAKELGFAQVQAATNGIVFAKDFDLLKRSQEAGLNTIYLSFDGVSDDIYLQARDRKMFDIKLKVLDNLRKLEKPPSVVLVPTIVKGLNDKQIGDIINFALKNSDVIRAVNFQPVAFTGRISREELSKGRFTLPDLIREEGEQTGYTTRDDWFPVPIVAPISKLASMLLGENKVTFTTHPHCGIATYLFQIGDGKVVPMTRFIDAEKISKGFNEIATETAAAMSKIEDRYVDGTVSDEFRAAHLEAYKSGLKVKEGYKILKLLNSCIIESELPGGMDKKKFTRSIRAVMSDKSKETLAAFSWKMVMLGGMHFQDNYNYDVERVRRCGVHYATPDLRVIPFCAYNGGPEYRAEVEKKFSVPLEEWKKRHGDEHC
ncbi:MAG: radical SAM protein [Methanomassiliicoccaceae archaeon]|nr:radical SAM protein [Methanomassiliicoccaceae archaeon]